MSIKNNYMEYIIKDANGCWNWTRWKDKDGYGNLRDGKKLVRAHRYIFEKHHDVKIPKNMVACHKCDNTSCVNPDHIFIGTYKDNTQDARRKGKYNLINSGEKSPNSKLNNTQILEIKKEYELYKTSYYKLAKKYNVTAMTIHKIIKNKSYKLAVTNGVKND